MANVRPVIGLLESRMSRELARLVEKHGGDPTTVPAVRECPELTPEIANGLIDDLASARHDVIVFMTGVAVSLLFETAEQLGRRPDLVQALRSMTTVCRGPKPTAALRGFGVPPTLTARDPYTSAELIDALNSIELKGRRVMLLHYGERSETLAETLLAREAKLEELWLYRWLMPEDTEALARLAMRIIAGDIDALAITCQIQFRHLYAVAEELGLAAKLVHALNERCVVAAVGPTCEAVLRGYGVRAQVMPEHPKMGPLVLALMRHLDQRAPHAEITASEPPRVTH
jgi:uroporphyrinogen-III synthase